MPDLESAIQQEQARRFDLEEEISRLGKLLADARRGVVAAEEKAKRELEERLFSDEAIEAAQLAEGAVWESELRNGEITPDKSRRMTLAALRAAYEAATTKPETCERCGGERRVTEEMPDGAHIWRPCPDCSQPETPSEEKP